MAMILMGERTGSPEKCWGSFVQLFLEPPGGHYQAVVVQASFVAAPTQRIVQVLRRYVARCRRRERAAPEASDARVEDLTFLQRVGDEFLGCRPSHSA